MVTSWRKGADGIDSMRSPLLSDSDPGDVLLFFGKADMREYILQQRWVIVDVGLA